jgi:hypothetical protein
MGRQDIVDYVIKDANSLESQHVAMRQCVEKGHVDLAQSLFAAESPELWVWVEAVYKNNKDNLTPDVLAQFLVIQKDLIALRGELGPIDKLKLSGAEKKITKILSGLSDKTTLEKTLLSIQLGLMEDPSKGVRTNLNSEDILSNRLVDTAGVAGKSKRQKSADLLNKREVDYPLNEALSFALISPSGNISPLLAKELLKNETFQMALIKEPLETQSQIGKVLRSFESDPDFGVRLSSATVPAPRSAMDVFVRQELQAAPRGKLNKTHAGSLIVGGMCVPTRQGEIGSCFATSLVIQQEKTHEGRRQILEDHLSLVNTEAIYREGIVEGRRDPYPGCFNIRSSPKLGTGHGLNRVREFTLASMGGGDNTNAGKKNAELQSSTMRQLDKSIKPNHPDFDQEYSTLTAEWFKKNTVTRFVPTVEDPKTGEMGAWVLHQKGPSGEKPVVWLKEFLALHRECAESILTSMSNDPKYQNQIEISKMWPQMNKEVRNNFESNLVSIPNPGGNQIRLDQKNREIKESISIKRTIESASGLYGFLTNYVEGLSDEMQKTIEKNPNYQVSLGMPEHALSLEPYSLLKLKNNKQVGLEYSKVNKNYNLIFNNEGLCSKVKEPLINYFKVVNPIAADIISSTPEPATLKTFLEAIRSQGLEKGLTQTDLNKVEASFLSTIYSLFQNQIHKGVVFADNNYDTSSKFTFSVGTEGMGIATQEEGFIRSNAKETYQGNWVLPAFPSNYDRFNLIRA